MKTKFKITMNVVSIIGLLTFLGYGVYAAQSVSLGIKGDVQFKSKGVYATIKAEGASEDGSYNTNYQESNYDQDQDGSLSQSRDFSSWNLGTLTFKEEASKEQPSNTYFVYTINIKNDTEEALDVTYYAPTVIKGIEVETELNGKVLETIEGASKFLIQDRSLEDNSALMVIKIKLVNFKDSIDNLAVNFGYTLVKASK